MNCLDCIYHRKPEHCTGDTVKCDYPMPAVYEQSCCTFTHPYAGESCKMLTTKKDAAKDG